MSGKLELSWTVDARYIGILEEVEDIVKYHNGQTRVYRLVSVPTNVWLRRKQDPPNKIHVNILF